jgi:hypothetical protein
VLKLVAIFAGMFWLYHKYGDTPGVRVVLGLGTLLIIVLAVRDTVRENRSRR